MSLYRKIIRECALQFCKRYAREQRKAADLTAKERPITALHHLQNAVAAETMVREIVIERTNEIYNKYNRKTTSSNEYQQSRRNAPKH